MTESEWLLAGLLAPCAWTGFCALANRWTPPPGVPSATDPGAEAYAALTALQPMPTGLHRDPGSPMPPFTYRTTTANGDTHA